MNDAFVRWLISATRDLAPAQRTRVEVELTAHYNDAVDAYHAEGYPDDTAARLALVDLGDPATTARAFAASGGVPWRLARLFVRRFVGSTGGRFTLALVALAFPLATFLINADRHATVVLLQTALLALILSIPLYFDDLDLSLGVVALMGTLLAQTPYALMVEARGQLVVGTHPVVSSPIGSVIVLAALAGALVGCMNGVIAGLLRRPLAQISAGTAVGLALVLQPFHTRHRSIWSVYPNWIDEVIGGPPVRYLHERGPVAGATAALFGSVMLLVVYAALRSPETSTEVALRRTGAPGRSWRERRLKLLAAGVALLPLVLYLARLNHAFLFDPFVMVLAVLVCTALVVIGDSVAHSRGGLWFTRREGVGTTRFLNSRARVVRLAVCSALAAVTGALITAHGLRDNTYEYAASFLFIVPLASLVVGGQHVLRGPYRLVGGIAGTLCIAALTSLPYDYKLNDDSVIALLLAAIAVAAWRWVLRPQMLAGAPIHTDTAPGEQPVHLDAELA